MISRYTQTCPVIFGSGAIGQIGDILKEVKVTRPFIVTDSGVTKAGITKRLKDLIARAGFECESFDGMQMDAPDVLCERAAGMAMQFRADGIIGLGGGSCMDAAKAVAVLSGNPHQNITELITGTMYEHQPIPMIMIPTTSGTGSENTIYAVVTCSQDGRKRSIITPADIAVVDPELTLGLNRQVTGYTGMDALSHSIEAYTSIRVNPQSDIFCIRAIEIVGVWLKKACDDGQNLEAREKMALASNLAGISFNSSATHIGHAMAHAIGAVFHVPHGIACAWVIPEVIEVMQKYMPERIEDIAEAMNTKGNHLKEHIYDLMENIGIPSAHDYGIGKEEILTCLDYACTEVLRGRCGADVSDEEIRQALIGAVTNY